MARDFYEILFYIIDAKRQIKVFEERGGPKGFAIEFLQMFKSSCYLVQ